jgi:glucosamine--fructose-6-phosphate aminotransferase (isomerizing)
MKHGPLALVDDRLMTVAIVPHGRTYEKVISNIQEIKSRHGKIISVATENDDKIEKISNHIFPIPRVSESLSPILTAVPLQLFAYYTARELGRDVDQPRNLAKSVTVE